MAVDDGPRQSASVGICVSIEPTSGAGGLGMTLSTSAGIGGPSRFTDDVLIALALLVADRDPGPDRSWPASFSVCSGETPYD